MAFLPQRPYLPLGTLRNAMTYPSPPEAFSDADVRRALERCDLGNITGKLDQVERWDKELSLGEQERLAFARLLLHKPGWVFLDEATAALDEDSQRHVMGLFDGELKNTTVLSIGHRPDLAAYHTRTLQLVQGRDGERLKPKPALAPLPPRTWVQSIQDWLDRKPSAQLNRQFK
jgi:putative ATP-binding cassette transporter